MKGLAENEPLWKDEKGKETGGFGGSRFNGGDRRGPRPFRSFQPATPTESILITWRPGK